MFAPVDHSAAGHRCQECYLRGQVRELTEERDLLRRENIRLRNEVARVEGELFAATEAKEIAERRADRAVAERDAACEGERETPCQFEAVTSW